MINFFKKLFGGGQADTVVSKIYSQAKSANKLYNVDDVEEENDGYDDTYSNGAGIYKPFKTSKKKPVGTGKAAGLGTPGTVPSNYNPDTNNPISVYRNVAGCTIDDMWDYAITINKFNWEKYDYTSWPCADMSFPDLDEDKSYDLWPFKPTHVDMSGHTLHWVDLNNQYKSGIERKGFIHGFTTPDRYIGIDAQQCLVELEALASERNEVNTIAAGFVSQDHLLYIIETTRKQIKKAYAEVQAIVDETNDKLNQQMNANIDAAKASGLLNPIKGISMEDWAAANAKIASGMPLNDVLKILGTEKPIWDEASAEWMARMSQDTTFAISKVYGDAFTNSNIGKFAGAAPSTDAANNPVVEQVKNDLDLYVKIMCHQNIGSTQGIDATSILKQYGLTLGDWGVINGFWSPKLGSNVENAMKMSALMDKYNAEFAAATPPKAGNDIDF
jgi:hypothetical protein